MEQEVRYDVRKENNIEVKLMGRKCGKCKIGKKRIGRITQCHILEDRHLKSHCCEVLKSQIFVNTLMKTKSHDN